jgi:4-hydroxybenzoate polyprenyltransferase
MLNPYLKLIRPTNWIKNIIIIIPLFLGKKFNITDSVNLLIGIISFSLMSSVGYIINDIRDIEKDRQHSSKKNRPLANGSANVKKSFYLAIVLFSLAVFLSTLINTYALLILIGYFLLNYFYSIKGKSVRLVDILIMISF